MPIFLKDKNDLEPAFKQLAYQISIPYPEYNFTNDYLFQHAHHYEVVRNPYFGIRGTFDSDSSFFIPAFDLTDLSKADLLRLLKFAKKLFPIPEAWVSLFTGLDVMISDDMANADYIYRIEKMSTLKGRNLSSRRNLLHQFERDYVSQFVELNVNNLDLAMAVLENWKDELIKNGGDKGDADYKACKMALEDWNDLSIFGFLCLADDAPVGFVIGELQSPTIALLHFAKSIHTYKGVTPYLYSHFAAALPTSVEWINLEQDLGILALRQAKMAYAPDHLEKKFCVELKSSGY